MDSISSAVDELMNNLSKLTDPTEITNEINAIYNLVKDAPETISDELMNALVSATTDVIDKIKNGEIEASEDFYNLLDNTLSIKTLSNSSVDISEVKEGVDTLVDALLESKNLTSITSGDESSSILFNGDSFSVQVSDNGNSTNAQAVLSSLPIVDYSACEKELIAAGIISEGTTLYAVNTCFSYTLSSNYDSSDEDTKSASCSLSSDIVDEYLNKVNTTSCSKIDVKLPTNNQIDSDLYTALSDQGIDIYDSDGEFFNNMCMRLAINSTDISVNGRRSIYTLSASCSSGCDYKGMDNNEYVVCSCDSVPSETENYFKSSVFSNILTSNILLVKCFKEAFDLDYLMSSWGLWAFTCSTCIGIIALIINLKCCYYYHLMNNIESVIFNDACYGVVPEKVGKVEYHIQSQKSNFNSNKYTSNDNSSNVSNNNNNIVKLVTSKEFKLNNIDDGSSSPAPLYSNNVKSKSFKENIRSILKASTPKTPKFIKKIFDVSKSKADYNDIKNNKDSKISFESREIPSINKNIIIKKLSKHDYSNINNILSNSMNDNNVSNIKEISKFQSKNSINLISCNSKKDNFSTSDVSSNNNKLVFNSPNSFISRVSQDGSDINKFDIIGSPTLTIKDNLLRRRNEKLSIACNYSPEIQVERLNYNNANDEDRVHKVRFHLASVNDLTKDFTKLDSSTINTNRSSVSKANTGNATVTNHEVSENTNRNMIDDINNHNKNNENSDVTSKAKHHTNKLYAKLKLLDQCDYNIKVNPLSNFYKKGNSIMDNINTLNNIKKNNINNIINNDNNNNDKQSPMFKSKSTSNITAKPELVGNNEDNKARIRKETNDNVNADAKIRNFRNLDIQSVSKKSFSEMEVQNLEDPDNSNEEQPASDLRSNMELVHFNSANKINLQNRFSSGKASSLFGNFMDKADKSLKFNSNNKTLELVSENSSALYHNNKNKGIDSKKSVNYDNISIKEDISNKDKTAEDVMKQFENITMKDIKTEADFQKLPVRMQIKIDDRSIWQFICHSLAYYHKALNVLLLKSIVNPLWIRIILLTMEFSFEFALNAIFFSMSTIDDIGSQKSGSGSTGLLYLLSNKFWSIFWPVVISTFIGSMINLIIRVPEKYALQLNSFLITKDKDNIKTG